MGRHSAANFVEVSPYWRLRLHPKKAAAGSAKLVRALRAVTYIIEKKGCQYARANGHDPKLTVTVLMLVLYSRINLQSDADLVRVFFRMPPLKKFNILF